MATPIVYNNTQNGQTEPVAAALGGQSVEVTSSGPTPPTVTLDAVLLLGSLDIAAENGATADVSVIAGAVGTLSLDADGGVIDASTTIGAIANLGVTIENGGTFIAESSFLTLLNTTTITFGANIGATNTLVLNTSGGLLNLSQTSPIAGFQTGGINVIDDKAVAGASVASYSITQAGSGQPDVLTFLNTSSASLGTVSFAAGTFNAGELGSYAVGYVGGPLQLTVGSDGGITTTTKGQVLDGNSLSRTVQAGTWVTLDSTGGQWDTVTGSQGDVYITNAQGSIVGGGDNIYFDNSAGDAASLYSTGGSWDSVYGSGAAITVNNAQANVIGGADNVYLNGVSGNQVSLYQTAGAWDSIFGANATIDLSNAQTNVTGGGDNVYVDDSSGNAVSFYNSAGAWDSVFGSNAAISLTNAQVNVTGGDDSVYLNGLSGNAVSIYNTAGAWDAVFGSNTTIIVTNSQVSVVGGGDTVYLSGASGAASFYNSAGVSDVAFASNASISLTNAQVSVVGGGDTVFFNAGSNNSANLSGNDLLSFSQGIGGQDVVTGAGSGDAYQFSKNDFADFTALSSHLSQTIAGTFITLGADSVELVGVAASSLTASQFSFT